MDRSLERTEWKPEESSGKHWQVGMPFLCEVPGARLLEAAVIEQASFTGCLNDAARHSGMDDQSIADAMHISAGYMSKFMRGVSEAWAKRLIRFMRTTKSLAPLQWIAFQMGCDLVIRDEVTRELAAARARVAELERRERMAA